jgi:hypothetical protein
MSRHRQQAPGCAVRRTFWVALLAASLAPGMAAAAEASASRRADFHHEAASEDATRMAQWILDADNNHGLSFMIIDKKDARVFVFDPAGSLRGASAALLGAAIGDDSVPGIGERKLSTILPQERTTPAGRFVAALDHNIGGKDILWVDYVNAISLHRVVTGNTQERRAQRLDSPTTADNRISYGCINVPPVFFDKVVMPAFRRSNGIVYILPETRPLAAVFAGFGAGTKSELP